MNIVKLSENIKTYVLSQINSLSNNTPIIGFMKPLITRALDKNFSKVTKALDLISDSEGNVDIENILSEMIETVKTTPTFTLKTSFAGNVEIGDGKIKLNIPLTDKRIVFNTTDLEAFREMLITKDNNNEGLYDA